MNPSEICMSLKAHYVKHSQKPAEHRGERSLFIFKEMASFYIHITRLYKPHPSMTPTWERNHSSLRWRWERDVALQLRLLAPPKPWFGRLLRGNPLPTLPSPPRDRDFCPRSQAELPSRSASCMGQIAPETCTSTQQPMVCSFWKASWDFTSHFCFTRDENTGCS